MNLDRYKMLFLESKEILKNKPLSQEDIAKLKVFYDEMNYIVDKLGYRERETLTTWCASEASKDWYE